MSIFRVINGGRNDSSYENKPTIHDGTIAKSSSPDYNKNREQADELRREAYLVSQQLAAGREPSMEDSVRILLERMDQDIRDHKKEIRDRDARIQQEMMEREQRTLKYMEDLLAGQKEMLDLKMSLIDSKLSNMNENIGHLRHEITTITSRVDSIHSRVDSLKTFIWGSIIAIAFGMAGIVYANWQVISAMLQMSKITE